MASRQRAILLPQSARRLVNRRRRSWSIPPRGGSMTMRS